MIFFSDFRWHDLGFLGKILIFLGILGKINCQDLGKKSKKSKILATNEKKSKILARNSRLSKIIQDLGKKTKTPSTGNWFNTRIQDTSNRTGRSNIFAHPSDHWMASSLTNWTGFWAKQQMMKCS